MLDLWGMLRNISLFLRLIVAALIPYAPYVCGIPLVAHVVCGLVLMLISWGEK